MSAKINYTDQTLKVTYQGTDHTFDLNEGDRGDFWSAFEHEDEVWDVNFAQEDPNQKASVSIYPVIDGERDDDAMVSLETETEGDPADYFSEWIQCEHCQTWEDRDNGGYNYDKDDKVICESCSESAWSYANTVVVCRDGEMEKFLWCSEFGYRNSEDWEEAKLDSVTGFKYVRTDGWRGYWNAQIGSDYMVLANGWSTGRWDDVAYKHGFNDFVEKIGSGDVECPFELVFAYGLTSNVFSVASDVVIKESDFEHFSAWIADEVGLSVEDLKRALS